MVINYTEISLGAVALFIIVRAMVRQWRQHGGGATARLYLAFGAVISIYVITNYFSLNPPYQTIDNQLFWIRFVSSLTGPMPVLAILLAATYPGDKFTFPKWALMTLVAGGLASFLLAYTPFVYSSLNYVKGIPSPQPEIGALFTFGLFFIGGLLTAVGVAIRGYLRAPLAEKNQRLYFIVGLITSITMMTLAATVPDLIYSSSATVFIGPLTWVAFFLIVPIV